MPARPRPKARAKSAAAPASKPVRRRGPNKPAVAAVSERPPFNKPVGKKKRVERSYSKQKKAEVVFWMHSQRFYDPFNPVSEAGWRRPTMRETGRHFSIPWTTLGSWYRNRHKFVEGLSPPPESEAGDVASTGGGVGVATTGKGVEGQVPSTPPPATAASVAPIPASSMPCQAFQYAPAPTPVPLHGVAAHFSATVPPRGMAPIAHMSGMPPPPG